ncbi:MAG TPA: hypothetical protein VMP67_11280 [Candidatus Limnocylindria bacterium]|nr:hypothetical protein [Candidatus Limnocylindria bacterium]
MSGPSGLGPVYTPPPQPARPIWPWASLGIALVVVAGLAVWLLLGGGGPAASPSPTPAAVVSPTPGRSPTAPSTSAPASPSASPGGSPVGSPSPPASPWGAPDDGVRAEIDAIVAQIPPLRQLEPLADVPYEFVSREEFQTDLQDLIDDETDPEALGTEERLLKRLGLLPEDLDLRETILELYGSQVAAFYRPDTGTFYIIGEPQTLGAFDKLVVAHEYTHALQDQHFDLESTRITDPSEGDAALAQLAAIEGDASLVMFQWGFANIPGEMLTIGDSLNPTDLELLESMPPILRRQLEFPYADGLMFSLAVFSQQFSWGPINETLRTPPVSTEQILHPDKYFAGEAPVEVMLPDLAAGLGVGWTQSYTQTMGELNIQVWVGAGEDPTPAAVPGELPVQPHAEAAAGWGGDRLAMYEHTDGGWAIAWQIEWDTPEDADEFLARAGELQGTLGGASEIVDAGPQTVRLVLADDQATLDALTAALGE